MKQLFFSLILNFLPVLVSAQGLEDVIVERYYISNSHDATSTVGGTLPSGSVTYRVWVDLAAGYKLRTVFSDPDNGNDLEIKTTTTFFNNTFGGTTTANDILDSRLSSNTVMLDSWISLGASSEGNIGVPKAYDSNGALYDQGATGFLQNGDPLAGTPIRLKDGMIPGTPAILSHIDLDLSVFGNSTGSTFYADNGSWWNLPGAVGDIADNKVLIAQLTTTGTLTFKLNFTLVKPDGISTERYIHSYPRSGATLCEKCTFNGVITSINEIPVESRNIEFRVFPNPAQDVLNIDLQRNENNWVSYSIYDIIGNKILERTNYPGYQKIIRDIDISSFPKGAYILRLISDSGLSSAKLFIKNQ